MENPGFPIAGFVLVLVLSGTVLVLGFPDRSPKNKTVDR